MIKIAPELSRRWSAAGIESGSSVGLTLKCQLGRVALKEDGGSLAVSNGSSEDVGEVVAISQESLTELVVGFRPVEMVLQDEGVEVSTPAQRLLNAVFPVRAAFFPPADQF